MDLTTSTAYRKRAPGAITPGSDLESCAQQWARFQTLMAAMALSACRPCAEATFYADGATEALSQHVLADLIHNHGHDRHIHSQRARYRRRPDQLITPAQT